MLTYSPPPHMDAKALIERAAAQLSAWHAKYSQQQPQWLPPAGDVRWLEDAAAYVAVHTLPAVTVAFAATVPRPACMVCGKPYAEHGSFPTCASHPYTPDGNCQHVIGAACVGAECKGGCVRARGVDLPHGAKNG